MRHCPCCGIKVPDHYVVAYCYLCNEPSHVGCGEDE